MDIPDLDLSNVNGAHDVSPGGDMNSPNHVSSQLTREIL